MSWSSLVRLLVSCYSSAWRERYGEEMSALTEDLLAGPYLARWRLAAGLAFGALAERLRPSLKSGKRAPPLGTLSRPVRWARQGSNLRPKDYESSALTTELRALLISTLVAVSASPLHGRCTR